MPTTKKAASGESPRRIDLRNRRAGEWAGRSGLPKVLASVFEVTPRRARQWVSGCPYSLPAKWRSFIAQHCRNECLDPWAPIGSAIEEVYEHRLKTMDEEGRAARFFDALHTMLSNRAKTDLALLQLVAKPNCEETRRQACAVLAEACPEGGIAQLEVGCAAWLHTEGN